MSKFSKEQLLKVLGYSDSPNYLSTEDQHHPSTAHLFREASRAGAEGAYTFHTSPNDEILPPRPAVYVAEAATREEAREIHRSLWNLGNAPFLIVVLPNEVRVYTGFDYDQKNQTRGLIDHVDDLLNVDLSERLADYSADSIDSGRLWANQAGQLKPDNRLDTHLLRNLKKLEAILCDNDLKLETAHALIGKYVYLRYLWDRGILSEQWRAENKIDIDAVLGRNATLKGLRRLVETLDERFNGHIFPLPLRGSDAPTNDQIALVASAFEGDDPVCGQMTAFGLYDFSYIPVETLSAIYEQFLHAQGKGKKSGAVYTPEHLADYLIAELNHAKPLESGMKILDPCCGSGIFLVLAYRKLIELELSKRPEKKLLPTELRAILTKSIYGVERNKEACLVTELSLILTMLHYISPPELHRNKQFKFPALHNEQIFEADFFDDSSVFWQRGERFDWVIGNPPWIEPEKEDKDEQLVISWINDKNNRQNRPIAGNRVVEAFSWRVIDLLDQNGCAGLVLHATSLFNLESKLYRKEFFRQNHVYRITNFANFAYILFEGRGEAPAATITFQRALPEQQRAVIIHYGPFVLNQIFNKQASGAINKKIYFLTINEEEISLVSPDEAAQGGSLTWKLALWGTYRDKRALQRVNSLFPVSLKLLGDEKGWRFHTGISLREEPDSGQTSKYKIEFEPRLKDLTYLDTKIVNESKLRFSIPDHAIKKIPENMCYLRVRTGKLYENEPGSISLVFHASYVVFSDLDFVLPNPGRKLSAKGENADELRALSVFFSSSVAKYLLFFLSRTWGIDKSVVYKSDIETMPIPRLSTSQIVSLSQLQRELVAMELEGNQQYSQLQTLIDEQIEEILAIPKSLSILAREFIQVRLTTNKGKIKTVASQTPQSNNLKEYGRLLRDQLDEFTKNRVRHHISFINTSNPEMIICEVEATNAKRQQEVEFVGATEQMKTLLSQLKQKLRQQFSQWVYVQRSLRIFDGPKVYICKAPRLIDWTRTQALNDADDLIAEVLSGNFGEGEVATNGKR